MPAAENVRLLDKLSLEELIKRDELINEGIKDCRKLLGKQKTIEDYFFYEGSIDGFEECKKINKFLDFEKRLEELHFEELREISKTCLQDDVLREHFKIYNKNEKTGDNEVFRIKGIKTQIAFVYERLQGFRIALSILEKAREKAKNSPNYVSACNIYSV